MQQLQENPELVRELGRNARATFEKNFTQDRFGADFRQLVNEAMARAREFRGAIHEVISARAAGLSAQE